MIIKVVGSPVQFLHNTLRHVLLIGVWNDLPLALPRHWNLVSLDGEFFCNFCSLNFDTLLSATESHGALLIA